VIGTSRSAGPARRARSAAAIGTLIATLSVAGSALTNASSAAPKTQTTATATADAPVAMSAYDAAALEESGLVARLVGARDLWACGYGGAGVDVALIDTGVAPVPGTGAIYNGPDLSFDPQVGTPAHLDAFGHGTHLASLINGRDPGVMPPSSCRTKVNANKIDSDSLPQVNGFAGIAPDARVVNLKVGAADGAVDVTQVIAAIDWAVQNRNRNGLNIRVLAIPYGVNSTSAPTSDPLSHAVSTATRAGIVVVAAAGNDGTSRVDLAYPARNPDVVTVAAVDRAGSTDPKRWTVAPFSDRGTTERSPDVLVPAVDTPGLRVPGSYIDGTTTTQGNRFVRSSGTSQATAIVAGLAAQLVNKFPTATPLQVKTMLRDSTWQGGQGQVLKRVPVLYANRLLGAKPATTTAIQELGTPTTGTAPVEALRSEGTLDINGVPLTGEIDVQGRPFGAWATAATAGTSWSGGLWLGGRYSATPTTSGVGTAPWGNSWAGTPFRQVEGYGGTWDGLRWSGLRWSGLRWSGSDWEGLRWSGLRWSGTAWDGLRWSGQQWSGLRWSGLRWSGAQWS
jgi:serine protease AprX